MGSPRLRVSVSTATLVLAFSVPARASNEQGYFLDADSSLSAGAVVATTEGPGSLWYNPAGLGGVDRPHVNLSISAGVIQFRQFENAITTDQPNGQTSRISLDGTRITLVSPSVTYVRKIGRLTLGLGLFTTRDDSLRVSGASATDDGAGTTSTQQTTLDDIVIRYHLGAGLGFQPTPKFRIGFSTYVVYEGVDRQSSVTLGTTDATTTPSTSLGFTAAMRDESVRYGAQATLGIQYRPIPSVELGLHVRSPILHLHESLDASTVSQLGVTGVADDGVTPVAVTLNTFDRHPRRAASLGWLAPPRFILGAAYRWNRGHVAIETDYSPPLQSLNVALAGADPSYVTDRRAVWNARIGTIFHVTESIEFGVGLYTDRSGDKRPKDFGQTQVNYYGATAGVRFESSIPTTNPGSGGRVVFRTTIAVRYAVGIGDAASYYFNLSRPSAFDFALNSNADVTFHELHLYVGSTMVY